MSSENSSTPSSPTEAVDRLQRAAGTAAQVGKQKAGELIDKSGAALSSAADQSSDAMSALGARVIDFTRENPAMALLLAAGAGALVATAIAASSLRR